MQLPLFHIRIVPNILNISDEPFFLPCEIQHILIAGRMPMRHGTRETGAQSGIDARESCPGPASCYPASVHIIFTRFPLESRFGGAEAQTLNLMKELQNRGHKVKFIGSCPAICKMAADHRIPIVELNIGPPPVTGLGAISFLWRQFSMKRMLIKKLAACPEIPKDKYAIVMLSLSEKLLITDWCVKRGMKAIWIEHDMVGRWLKMNPWLSRLRRLSRMATTVAVSDLSRDIYVGMGWRDRDIAVIPNGIPGTGKCDEVNKKRKNGKDFRIGCVARLSRDKGVDLLIEAAKGIPDAILEIVGSGPEEKRLRNSICKTQTSIIASIADIEQFYNRIDCLVLPSRKHDPFGLVVAEAMAAGVPTICTEACGISRHLDAGESLIVPADDMIALREAIVEVQKEGTWSRLSEMGPKAAQQKFSSKKMADKYENLISGI